MSFPENPNTIILKNKFYPRGLTEKNVYDYYIKVKGKILNEVKTRDLMFAIMIDINKPVIRRKLSGKFITLTPSNYEKIITGRTIAIYSTMKFYEDIAIVDIDADTFEQSKQPTIDTYNTLINTDFIKDINIRYTGKTGFHIFCTFYRKMKIDNARLLLERYLLTKKEITNKYTIEARRKKGTPNIDLWASNKLRGAYITLNSLSIIGLQCMEVPENQILSFRAEQAII